MGGGGGGGGGGGRGGHKIVACRTTGVCNPFLSATCGSLQLHIACGQKMALQVDYDCEWAQGRPQWEAGGMCKQLSRVKISEKF